MTEQVRHRLANALPAIKGKAVTASSRLLRSLACTKISGSNLYTRLNYWIVACGGTAVSNPPALVGVENPGAATIACQGETFTFTVACVPSDVTNLKLVIEASEGQSNSVTGEKSGTMLAECKWTAGE